MWGKRIRVAEIAAALGTSSNAIIGKAHRLGLKAYSPEESAKHISDGMRASKSIRVPRETAGASA